MPVALRIVNNISSVSTIAYKEIAFEPVFRNDLVFQTLGC